jgi:tetratricopeptide (TPR) repeat protein/predicted Ser/Thr protein kinase
MECFDDAVAHDLVRGTLDAARGAAAREHLDSCTSCKELVALAAAATETAPETIGRYQIQSVLGTGAMGIVYEAIDPQLERRVAIKLLRSASQRVRLLREATAAAQISHPNVIAVFDAGVADGEVFMAMELIRGATLRQWLAAGERTWREILEVGVAAGRGIAAIHAAGLVHRDIKPDNVLVADSGRIVVTDLGLVRLERGAATEARLDLTQTGAILGTPAYAAPEQLDADADADARCDQFSYCATLFEAFTGARPFEAKTLAELREAIDRGPPPIAGELPPAVTAAIARGLAADPAARWPTLDVLVAELARVLAPRHRGRWIAIGGIGLAAAAAAIVFAATRTPAAGPRCDAGAGELARVWNPTVRGEISAAFGGAKAKYAASAWTATAQALDGYGAKWSAAYDAACVATNVHHVQSPAMLDLRVQCLDRRRVELGALLDVFAKSAPVDQAADAVAALTSPDACGDAELLAATDAMPDAPALRQQVTAARATLAHASALAAAGEYKPALAQVRALAAAHVDFAPFTAELEAEHARIATDMRELDEAKTALDAAMLAAERGREHVIRAQVYLGLAYIAMQKGDNAGALAQLDRADAVIAGAGGAAANRAKVEDYRGNALAALDRLDEANAALAKSVALYEQGEGRESISLASPLTIQAFVANQRGDLATAVKLLERALAIQLKALGPDHPRVAIAHTNLAFNLSAADRLDEAQQHAEAGRAIFARSLGENSELYAEASRSLAGILERRGEHAKSEAIARDVVAKLAATTGRESVRYGNAVEDLAQAVRSQHRFDEALALRREALAVREKALPPGHPALVASLVDLGEALVDVGRCKDALAIYARAQAAADGPDIPPYLPVAARLGRGHCLVATGQKAAALPILREAVARLGEPKTDDDRKLADQAKAELARAQ